ncbi:MAG: heavy metal-binding domain-containing protein [Deltaproteobacteria bacterium]|jgi:uncharacterized protein YbjQ (UPF0145 family)|nr:heavy metal-binding domain-containing protein [Deltaproteobacteria bacterium]
MDKQCARCGKDMNPLTGLLETSHTKVDQLRKWGIDVPSPICSSCFNESLLLAERRYGNEFNFEEDPPPDLLEKIEKQVSKLDVWTLNPFVPGSIINLGLVSHYIIVGTGPLSSLASTFTDLLGQNDELYQERLEAAEAACLRAIKEKAFNKGASAVVGLQLSVAELAASHGMFMVGMAGNAVTAVRIYRP